jgi:hypothetical protein
VREKQMKISKRVLFRFPELASFKIIYQMVVSAELVTRSHGCAMVAQWYNT